MTDTSAKRDVQKLQRAIVDGLEDVKAQHIVVFNTEHMSPLFERVVIASGTSNRQTKALAASVRDKIREAGFPKPRIEGEENGDGFDIRSGGLRRIGVDHILMNEFRTTMRQCIKTERMKCFQLIHWQKCFDPRS